MTVKRVPSTWAIRGLALAGAYYTLRALRQKQKARQLQRKVVLITGGSKGLGMILARDFARAGARVAICARSVDELEKARSWVLRETGSGLRGASRGVPILPRPSLLGTGRPGRS